MQRKFELNIFIIGFGIGVTMLKLPIGANVIVSRHCLNSIWVSFQVPLKTTELSYFIICKN